MYVIRHNDGGSMAKAACICKAAGGICCSAAASAYRGEIALVPTRASAVKQQRVNNAIAICHNSQRIIAYLALLSRHRAGAQNIWRS